MVFLVPPKKGQKTKRKDKAGLASEGTLRKAHVRWDRPKLHEEA